MSGGQRQRVALGRALVRDPKVFLLDEPLSNLDAKLRAAMRTEITALHKSLGTTFIYVTHDQVEAMTMGTRIVVMKNGYIQQIDTPMNLYNTPYNKFVAGFIGTPQMNFFDVSLERKGNTVNVTFGNGDRIGIPYEAVSKADRSYLDGSRKVIFGVRPEHFEINREGRGLKFIVTNVERLGNETIIYGKLGDHLGEFTVKDEGNNIVVKVIDRDDIALGDVVYAEPKQGKLHFFDAETEVTLIEKIPSHNTVDATAGGGNLSLFERTVAMPPVVAAAFSGVSEAVLSIPPEAIVPGGDFSLRIAKIEDTERGRLAFLEYDDRYLFALVGDDAAEGGEYGFSLLWEKIGAKAGDATLLEPVPDEESFTGGFSKKEVKENGNRVLHFFYDIAGYSLETAPEQGYRINSIDGDGCYTNVYRYVVRRDAVREADSSENGLDATVTQTLDYGSAFFAKAKTADGQEFLVNVGPGFDRQTLKIAFDSRDVTVRSTRIDMIVC